MAADGVVGNRSFAKAMALGFELVSDPADMREEGPNWPPEPDFPALVGNRARQRLFGPLRFEHAPTETNAEAITILDDWRRKNIVRVDVPQLGGIRSRTTVPVHELIAEQFVALWAAWEAEGLLDRVLTWHGSFVARLVRGSSTKLSNHAFGTAFDINRHANRLGHQPARVGETGSVRELVPIANERGFFWGGHFRRRPDGMHFEVAEIIESLCAGGFELVGVGWRASVLIIGVAASAHEGDEARVGGQAWRVGDDRRSVALITIVLERPFVYVVRYRVRGRRNPDQRIRATRACRRSRQRETRAVPVHLSAIWSSRATCACDSPLTRRISPMTPSTALSAFVNR